MPPRCRGHGRRLGPGVRLGDDCRLAAPECAGGRPAPRNGFPVQFARLGHGAPRDRGHRTGSQGSGACRTGLLYGHVHRAEEFFGRDLRCRRTRDPQTRQRRPELYGILAPSGRRRGLLLARTGRCRSSPAPSATATKPRTETDCSARCASSRCRPTSASRWRGPASGSRRRQAIRSTAVARPRPSNPSAARSATATLTNGRSRPARPLSASR